MLRKYRNASWPMIVLIAATCTALAFLAVRKQTVALAASAPKTATSLGAPKSSEVVLFELRPVQPVVSSLGPSITSLSLRQPLNLWSSVPGSSPPPNNPPTATADTFTGLAARHQDAPGVLANDSDPDGDPLYLDTAPVVNPQHGTVNLYVDGRFYYTPNSSYAGSDTFTYQVCDNHGGCANGVATLTNANHGPSAGSDTFTGLGARFQAAPGVLANDSDPDGDPLHIELSYNYQPQHGHVTLYGGGEFYYGPATGYVGTDSFTYQVCDNFGACTYPTVTLIDANSAPVAAPDFYFGTPASFNGLLPTRNLLVNDYDFEGDSFSMSLPPNGRTQQNGYINGYGGGDIYYTPPSGFSGTDSFIYTVCDNLGACSNGTVYLVVWGSPGLPPKVPYSCDCPNDPAVQSSFNPQAGGFAQVSGGAAGESGPQNPDPVNLATGHESYMPNPDLTVYNPSGPAVVWQRSYSGDQALSAPIGYGSPGLTLSRLDA